MRELLDQLRHMHEICRLLHDDQAGEKFEAGIAAALVDVLDDSTQMQIVMAMDKQITNELLAKARESVAKRRANYLN